MDRRRLLKTIGGTGTAALAGTALTGTATAYSPDTITIRTFRETGTDYVQDWDDRCEELLSTMETYLEDHVGIDSCVTANYYEIDNYTVDMDLGMNEDSYGYDYMEELNFPIPINVKRKNDINMIIIEDSRRMLGRALGGSDWDSGAFCWQNTKVPSSWNVVDTPERYRVPNMMHEVLHLLMDNSNEHGGGDQRYDAYNGVTETSAMATGYTFASQSQPQPTTCSGGEWDQFWNMSNIWPQKWISNCTDLKVHDFLNKSYGSLGWEA